MSDNTVLATAHSHEPEKAKVLQVILYGHSTLFYWWPLWVAGYVMALLTWLSHDKADIGNTLESFNPNGDLGLIYTLLLLGLIVITSTKVKGVKAALGITAAAFVAVLFAYVGWWQGILAWLGHRSIALSLGFYFFSSSILLLVWLVSVFIIDHMSYWRFRPGQITHEFFGGIVDQSYDTNNMTIMLSRQDDFFRHWIIGLASGDLHMRTMGGQGKEMNVMNILFIGGKMTEIQRLIATKPGVPQQA